MSYSHLDGYKREVSKFSMIREKGGFRTPLETLDQALARSLAIDIPEEGEVVIPRPVIKRERYNTIGGGRKANIISELGYEPVEETINFYFQTARLLYAVMGACQTTGVSYGSPITRTISAGQGTKTLTFSTGGLTVNAHAGDYLLITSGPRIGYKYCILSNAVDSITTDINTKADIGAATCEIKTGPYTYLITEGTDLPSFASHYYEPNNDAAESVVTDLLGILIKALELTTEINGNCIQAASFHVAKGIDGNLPTGTPPICPIPDDLSQDLMMKWCNVDTLNFEYNSENPITKDIVDRIVHNIENDAEAMMVMGDCYGKYKRVGTLDHTLTLSFKPFNRTLRDLRNYLLTNYLSDIDCTIKYLLDADHYFEFVYSKLYLDEYPDRIPAKDAIKVVEAVFKVAPGGSLVINGKGDLGLEYMEGSTII